MIKQYSRFEMLVELPHALNEYVEDIELDVLADVGKIFPAKR